MNGNTCKIFPSFIIILQLRHIEDSILLRANHERIVVGFPSTISCTIIQTVSESPFSLGNIKVKGQPGMRIVGYRIAGSYGREDSLRTVQEKCRNVRGEEIFVHIPHTYKQMARIPLVHVAQHGKQGKMIIFIYVGKSLPVINNAIVGLCHMQRCRLKRILSFSNRNTQFQPQLIHQIGVPVHIPLPFRNILSVKALCISKADIDAT